MNLKLLTALSGVGVTLAALLGFGIGNSVGHQAATDQAVVAKLASDKAHADTKYQQTLSSIKENQSKLDTIAQYDAKIKDFNKQISDIKSGITSKQKEAAEISSRLSVEQDELASLTKKVDDVKSQPINLPAGHFTVGSDIRAGRYAVTGSSNFIVRGTDGDVKVNTILGDNGVNQYICHLDEGDEVDAESEVTLYPM